MTAREHPDDPREVVDAEAVDDELLEAAASAEDASAEGGPADAEPELSEIELVLAALVAERDEYLDALQRVKAEFDNYKRRTDRERIEAGDRANARLAESLLPVLDACEAALTHGATDVEPVYKSLVDALAKAGLEGMAPEGEPFDPTLHEAVAHEPGDGGEPVVAESLRRGYQWKGVVVRPAMVKVRG